MAKSVLSAPHFQDEEAAFAFVEAHLWPTGPVCPHCGNCDQEKIGKLKGKTTRPGLYKCYEPLCRKPFTVRQGTIFESSHVALHLWLQIIHLMCASKKGFATRQIQRLLNCSMKTAWFMGHRIREMMNGDSSNPMGGEGETVEMDEAYIGGREKNKHRNKRLAGSTGGATKTPVFALVQRGGKVRAFHMPHVTADNVAKIMASNVERGSALYSDEGHSLNFGADAYRRGSVRHSKGEYVRGDVHTNTVEGFFAILKRGLTGVYHGVSEAHLQRYLAEFGHRYSHREALGVDDVARASVTLEGAKGKRLTYETTRSAGRA